MLSKSRLRRLLRSRRSDLYCDAGIMDSQELPGERALGKKRELRHCAATNHASKPASLGRETPQSFLNAPRKISMRSKRNRQDCNTSLLQSLSLLGAESVVIGKVGATEMARCRCTSATRNTTTATTLTPVPLLFPSFSSS